MARPKKETVVEKVMGAALPKDENGVVDWRNIVNPKTGIILNRAKFAKLGIDVEKLTPEEELNYKKTADPEYVYISLTGCRELAKKRGYDSLVTNIISQNSETVSFTAQTTIRFLPNEEEPNGVVFTGIGEASKSNVNVGFSHYTAAIAENRSTARAIRNYFLITSLAEDEKKNDEDEKITTSGLDPLKILQTKLDERGISFEDLKELGKEKKIWKEEWKSFSDLTRPNCFVISTTLLK